MNRVEIYRAWCKQCGICIAFCPQQALEVDEASYPVVKDAGKCTGCGLCEVRCPDSAIEVYQDERSRVTTDSPSRQ
jgi:2-oxoglutarate ferredoxin oxidoreductase subunit delta